MIKKNIAPNTIIAGQVYEDREGFQRYVVSIAPAQGRRVARVNWRRPGAFATKVQTQTISSLAAELRRCLLGVTPDPAPALPNAGLAVVR